MANAYLVALIPREPDSWPTALSIWTTREGADAELARLDALVEPLRAAAHALYLALEEAGTFYGDYPSPLDAQRRALFDAQYTFNEQHGFFFDPNFSDPRDHHWQPIFAITELPCDPSR